jgi:DNA repair protein RadC
MKPKKPALYKMELRRRACRLKEAEELYNVKIVEPSKVAKLAQRLLKDEAQEVVLFFFLDTRNKIIGYIEAARGGLDLCLVDPKVVFSSALLAGATALIMVHNHPTTGVCRASPEDMELTERLADGARLLGMQLLDHIIVGRKGYTSFAESGLLETVTVKGP